MVLFDVGDTVVQITGYDLPHAVRHILQFAEQKNIDVSTVISRARELNTLFESELTGNVLEYSQRAFHRLLYEGLGISFRLSAEEIEREYFQHVYTFEPAPGIHDALAHLHHRGVRTAALSNSSVHEAALRAELARHRLEDRFEFIIATADYGIRKPHPAIFAVALARAGLSAERVWYVGDRLEVDVKGAHEAGLHAAWYNPGRAHPDDGSPEVPDAELNHWLELSTLFTDSPGNPT